MAVKQPEEEAEAPKPTVEINNLRFTYPGIDGHPPPGSTPLIQDFSLCLYPGDRCLLVGSNGAGSFLFLTLFPPQLLKKSNIVFFSPPPMEKERGGIVVEVRLAVRACLMTTFFLYLLPWLILLLLSVERLNFVE